MAYISGTILNYKHQYAIYDHYSRSRIYRNIEMTNKNWYNALYIVVQVPVSTITGEVIRETIPMIVLERLSDEHCLRNLFTFALSHTTNSYSFQIMSYRPEFLDVPTKSKDNQKDFLLAVFTNEGMQKPISNFKLIDDHVSEAIFLETYMKLNLEVLGILVHPKATLACLAKLCNQCPHPTDIESIVRFMYGKSVGSDITYIAKMKFDNIDGTRVHETETMKSKQTLNKKQMMPEHIFIVEAAQADAGAKVITLSQNSIDVDHFIKLLVKNSDHLKIYDEFEVALIHKENNDPSKLVIKVVSCLVTEENVLMTNYWGDHFASSEMRLNTDMQTQETQFSLEVVANLEDILLRIVSAEDAMEMADIIANIIRRAESQIDFNTEEQLLSFLNPALSKSNMTKIERFDNYMTIEIFNGNKPVQCLFSDKMLLWNQYNIEGKLKQPTHDEVDIW